MAEVDRQHQRRSLPTWASCFARALGLGLLTAALAGCGDDACEAMCDAAEARVTTCLESEDRDWVDLGWSDVTDFRDFCATWAEEARALDQQDACPTMTTTFEEGDCAAWPLAFAGSR